MKKQEIIIEQGEKFAHTEVCNKGTESNPMTHIGSWDFMILFLAIMLRFLFMAKKKVIKLEAQGREFNVSAYFDFKHALRWTLHICSALIMILILPEIFVSYIQPKYFDGLDIWTLFGSGVIGFLGYDIVRIIEKISLLIMKKFGYTKDA